VVYFVAKAPSEEASAQKLNKPKRQYEVKVAPAEEASTSGDADGDGAGAGDATSPRRQRPSFLKVFSNRFLKVFEKSKTGKAALIIDVISLITLTVALVVTTIVLFSYSSEGEIEVPSHLTDLSE